MKFGVQTFTVRKMQKRCIKSAYLPLINLGIKQFEVARIKFNEKNAKKIKELIDEFGIEIVSIQVKPKDVFKNSDKVIEFCNITGCKNVVISMLPFGCILGSEAKFYNFISTLDAWCDTYGKSGITLAYHHHNWEYVTLTSGKTRMAELLFKTEKLKFVHDTYWTVKSGIAPERQIREFGDRLLGIHLRDLTFKKRGLDVVGCDCAIGEGVIDFSAVLSAADEVGCRYCVIEQKTKDPYRDIEKSLASLNVIAKE